MEKLNVKKLELIEIDNVELKRINGGSVWSSVLGVIVGIAGYCEYVDAQANPGYPGLIDSFAH